MAKRKNTSTLLRQAIRNQEVISFFYKDNDPGTPGERVNVQPVAFGLSKSGNLVFRGYVKRPSVSHSGLKAKGDWRMFLTRKMSNVKTTGAKWRAPKAGFNPLGDEGMSTVIEMWTPVEDIDKLTEDLLKDSIDVNDTGIIAKLDLILRRLKNLNSNDANK